MWLFPPCIEELIPQNHIVGTVNTAINEMHLSNLLRAYKGGGTSSYHPLMLLKVLIYAYTQKIYSSRNISKALRENVNFMWIAGNNRPDFRTINRFRSIILKENIEKVFASVLEILFEKGFIKFENYFLDGTTTDHDATFMRMKEDPMMNGQLKAGYNVQIGTENQFIPGYSIHQMPTDTTTLIPHINKLKEIIAKLPENIIADAGYGSVEKYVFIESEGIGNYVKYQYFHKEQQRKFKKEIFRTENLHYNPEKDEFTCPAGKILRYTDDKQRITDNGYLQKTKIYTADDCRWCRKRTACHKSRYNRRIEINPVLAEFKKTVSAYRKSEKGLLLRSKRPVEVESVFGHIKLNRGFKRFLLRGLDNVSTEWGLISIAHNLFKMNLAMGK